jgi:hypothetical protein
MRFTMLLYNVAVVEAPHTCALRTCLSGVWPLTRVAITFVATLQGFNPTRNDFFAYANHSAERFNTTYNHPFWNSQVSPGFSTTSLKTNSWANPSTGVVHMYHSGGWYGARSGFNRILQLRLLADAMSFGLKPGDVQSNTMLLACPLSDSCHCKFRCNT